MPPLLLLDVDGVIAPSTSVPPSDFQLHDLDFDAIWWSPRLAHRLNCLRELFELVWCTSWEDDANRFLAPLHGLPALPVVRFAGADRAAESYKLDAVSRFCGQRPVAWADDEHGADVRGWARRRNAPTLLVTPEPSRGLSDDDIRVLASFAQLAG